MAPRPGGRGVVAAGSTGAESNHHFRLSMRVQVPMPQMGESIAEGTVSVWLKKVGDRVERDETLMEISTDKVAAEIPSPASGTLVEILVQEGETVEVGTVVAYIETDAAAAAGGEAPAPSAAKNENVPAADGVPAPTAAPPSTVPAPVEEKAAAAAARQDRSAGGVSPPRDGDGNEPESAEERLRRRSTPLVRRIAAEHGVSLDQIRGTGRAGRVTKDDILRFIESGGVAAQPAAERGAATPAGFYEHVEHPEVEVGPEDRAEPMSRMTQLIAEHMVLSRRISAHVHSYFEVDYSRVDQIRAKNASLWA